MKNPRWDNKIPENPRSNFSAIGGNFIKKPHFFPKKPNVFPKKFMFLSTKISNDLFKTQHFSKKFMFYPPKFLMTFFSHQL